MSVQALPPSPSTNSSESQQAEARAPDLAVRHLSNRAAAERLGITAAAVRCYRNLYPDLAPPYPPADRPAPRLVVVNAAPAPKPAKQPTRSVTYGGTSISLPREPFLVPSDRPAWEVRA